MTIVVATCSAWLLLFVLLLLWAPQGLALVRGSFGQNKHLVKRVNQFPFRLHAGKTSEKCRVVLQCDVPTMGSKGDIVMVSNSQFLNVLQAGRLGRRVTDEEVDRRAKLIADLEQRAQSVANELAEKIGGLLPISILRKVGPGGQLFGSVTHKQIVDAISEQLSDAAELAKSITVTSLVALSGGESVAEIRAAGQFIAQVHVPHATVAAAVTIDIRAMQ